MALIYSRPRIKVPKLYIFNSQNPKHKKHNKKLYIILIIIILIVLSCEFMIKAIKPVFNKLCSEEAKSLATIICNQKTTECVKQYNYSDFVIIHKDANDNVTMLEANMYNINIVTSDIAEKIQIEMNNSSTNNVYISAGNFTGISLLAGKGPKIPIQVSTTGNVQTDLKSEFVEMGVNQTLHRLYLEIECEISILTPFNTMSEAINNQFIIAENVIVGNIPSTYYNLEGLNNEDTLELVE